MDAYCHKNDARKCFWGNGRTRGRLADIPTVGAMGRQGAFDDSKKGTARVRRAQARRTIDGCAPAAMRGARAAAHTLAVGRRIAPLELQRLVNLSAS